MPWSSSLLIYRRKNPYISFGRFSTLKDYFIVGCWKFKQTEKCKDPWLAGVSKMLRVFLFQRTVKRFCKRTAGLVVPWHWWFCWCRQRPSGQRHQPLGLLCVCGWGSGFSWQFSACCLQTETKHHNSVFPRCVVSNIRNSGSLGLILLLLH